MPSIKGLFVENKKVHQTIDLEEITGVDFEGYEHIKLAIAQETIDYMHKRTAKGEDIFNTSFQKYSKEYKKSEDFQAFGKSSKVNMKLKGDMLGAIDFDLEGNTLKFILDDTEEELKAYGHMTGMKGHKVLDGKAPKRMFFGISGEDFEKKILTKFNDELESIKKDNKEESILEKIAENSLAKSTNSSLLETYLQDIIDDEEF
jgi:hypothetical protein